MEFSVDTAAKAIRIGGKGTKTSGRARWIQIR
jgi:hypothetical protein